MIASVESTAMTTKLLATYKLLFSVGSAPELVKSSLINVCPQPVVSVTRVDTQTKLAAFKPGFNYRYFILASIVFLFLFWFFKPSG